MDRHLLDCVLASIEEEHGVDPFSWEFIFNERYARLRNKSVLGPESRSTLLSLIFWRMNDSQRERIFPGTFDLGGRREAHGAIYTREDLAEELNPDRQASDATLVPGTFRTIESWIREMTGSPLRAHLAWNSLKALKVLKLFYRLQKERQRSFLRLVRQVRPGKGSLEHRDRYPMLSDDENESQVWLLADLRSYLGSELEPGLIGQVETVFSSLLQRADQRVNATDARLRNQFGELPEAWCQAYRLAIAESRERCGSADRQVAGDLDKLLFVYAHALEFLHFVAEYNQIVEKTIPKATISSVRHEIDDLPQVLRDAGGGPLCSEHVRISAALSFYRLESSGSILRSIVAKATGCPIDADSYVLLTARSMELLSRYFAYRRDSIDYGKIRISLRSCVVALCAVWLEMCNETEYEPYWMGQPAQGKRILRFLDQSFLEQGSLSGQFYPEAIDQIWILRFEWMADAVQGRQEVGRLKAMHKCAVLNEFASAVKQLDIDTIESAVQAAFLRSNRCQ